MNSENLVDRTVMFGFGDSHIGTIVLTVMLLVITGLFVHCLKYFKSKQRVASILSEEEKQIQEEEERMKGCKLALFIDNSNLFIEGMRLHARHLKLMVPFDPSFRINYDSLCKRLLNGRKLDFGKLYGSEPPRNDALWDKIREGNIFVCISERASSGEEKEVDSNLNIDATKLIFSNDNETPGTVILLSGDRDFRPVVRELLRKQWKVELYAFEGCLSGKFKELESKEQLLTITYIESIFGGQNEWHFVKRLSSKPPNQDSTIVLKFEDQFSYEDNKKNLRELANNLTEMLKIPCILHATCDDGKMVSRVFVTGVVREPKDSKKSNIDFIKIWKESETDITQLFLTIRSVVQIDDYVPVAPVENVDHAMEENQVEVCSFSFWCRYRSLCHKSHTDDEKRDFSDGKDRGYKTKPCHGYHKRFICRNDLRRDSPSKCFYYHNESEARCCRCGKVGHAGDIHDQSK